MAPLYEQLLRSTAARLLIYSGDVDGIVRGGQPAAAAAAAAAAAQHTRMPAPPRHFNAT